MPGNVIADKLSLNSVQIVSKLDQGLLNAYKPRYFDKNISEKGDYLSCVTNDEFHLKNIFF